MVKIGLIGCGAISRSQVNAVAQIEDASIVAASDIAEANLQRVVEQTGAVGYADYKQMVKECDLDLVIIALPHGLHNEAACFCAEQGVDVFLEKPMGISSEDCQSMIDCCKKNNVMLWVGHLQCYMPVNVFAKQLIDSGEYGELVSFTEVRNGEYFTERRPAWFSKKKMSGGGITINLGAHALDKLKFFTNNAKIKDIQGAIHLHEGTDCEDGVQAVVIMDNGVTGTLNLIGYTTAYRYETVLYLTKGEIRICMEEGNVVEHCKHGEPMVRTECDRAPGMLWQLQEVVKTIRSGERRPVIDGEYGLDIIHAVKRLYGDEA